MRAKAKKSPMCSVSLIAIELKGLAALGEALKIIDSLDQVFMCILQPQQGKGSFEKARNSADLAQGLNITSRCLPGVPWA